MDVITVVLLTLLVRSLIATIVVDVSGEDNKVAFFLSVGVVGIVLYFVSIFYFFVVRNVRKFIRRNRE